jgi:hypothetical protein
MYAMQYEIPLPADYDMTIIRHRVASKGHLTDDYPDLGLKAYLIREKGIDGALNNEYAPFYLWNAAAGMNRFLWTGTGFTNIVGSFGRPPVRHFVGVDFRRGTSGSGVPTRASRLTTPITADSDPTAAVDAAVTALERLIANPALHAAAIAVDPLRWEIVTFALWLADVPPDCGRVWQVLHLSRPEIDGLATWAGHRRRTDPRHQAAS